MFFLIFEHIQNLATYIFLLLSVLVVKNYVFSENHLEIQKFGNLHYFYGANWKSLNYYFF